MSVVVFDPVAFVARYPEFSAVTNPRMQACFNDAGLYLSNTDASPVQSIPRRTSLLWMLTAHILTIGGALSVDGKPLPVGRIDSGTEGSVTVGLKYTDPTPGSGAWFNQTQYGASFWQATTALRGFRYFARPTVPR